jgi:hypothetical protein
MKAQMFWLGGFRTPEKAEAWAERLRIRFPQFKFEVGVSTRPKPEYWRHYVATDHGDLTDEQRETIMHIWQDVESGR